MKKVFLISCFVFLFFGCGSSSKGNTVKYMAGDSVIIIKNIEKSVIPLFKNILKEKFKKDFIEQAINVRFKDYESENCLSFGFKFDNTTTEEGFIQTTFIKDGNAICNIQDYSINDAISGNGGLVVFTRQIEK